jgi:tetratricopeptide (TPR) repeat protein
MVSARPQSGRIGLSVIVVPTEAGADELRLRIREGASFEALAVAYSVDATAVRGGYMGVVDESSLRREFRQALEGLKPGAVSSITRVGESYILLKRTTADEDRWRSEQDSAHAAIRQGEYRDAATIFLSAIQHAQAFGKEDIRLAESLNGLAQVYRYQQNYTGAEPPARQSLAILERSLGNGHEALIPSLINLAGIARAREKYGEAEQFYRRILANRWGMPGQGVTADQVLDNFAEVLSLVQSRDPRLEKALDTFWHSLADSNLNKDVFLQMRDRFMTAQLVPEAEALMLRAVRLYPDSRQLRYRLGELYATWGKYEKAIEVFEDADRLSDRINVEADRIQRSRIYERIGEMNFFLVRFDEAVSALTKSVEINPANTGSRMLLGAIYTRRNRFEEAAAEYRRVIAASPNSAAAYEGLSQVELSLGRYRESAIEADKALAIDAGLQAARYNKAMALIRDGREEGKAALEDYQQREAAMRSAQARRNDVADFDRTATNMLAEDRPQKAIEALREGIKAHPLSALLHSKLGMIQSRLNLHKEAAATFETMVSLKIDDFLVHRQLAREYELLGNRDGVQQQRVLYLQRYDAALQSGSN